jgi:mediator of RNA polymerase II transcription subunit 18
LSVPEGTGALEPLDAPIPTLSECKPVDPSGAYLIEACVRVLDSTNTRIVEQAMQELLAFKKQLEGTSVDLRAPERLALDTRLKSA